MQHLRVPENRIKCLLGQEATKEEILKAVSSLKTLEEIQKDRQDAILIYFAGHGTHATDIRRHGYGDDGRVQLLIPYDCDDKDIGGISGNQLVWLLGDLAAAKGDNIVSII